jgi:septal ring factor EnvC (AmiA/AmiB activator)
MKPAKALLMKKIKYYYNTTSLRYEKLETPLRVKLLRIFGFVAAAFVTATFISFIAFRFVGSPNEKILRNQNERLRDRYRQLNDQLKTLQQEMTELEKRDNTVYRAIFEANPIPDSARAKDLEKQLEITNIESMRDNELVTSIISTLNNLSSRMGVQKTSIQNWTDY